jgi:hypothetical protein
MMAIVGVFVATQRDTTHLSGDMWLFHRDVTLVDSQKELHLARPYCDPVATYIETTNEKKNKNKVLEEGMELRACLVGVLEHGATKVLDIVLRSCEQLWMCTAQSCAQVCAVQRRMGRSGRHFELMMLAASLMCGQTSSCILCGPGFNSHGMQPLGFAGETGDIWGAMTFAAMEGMTTRQISAGLHAGMTYEEMLDLQETIGHVSRGASPADIALVFLPSSCTLIFRMLPRFPIPYAIPSLSLSVRLTFT